MLQLLEYIGTLQHCSAAAQYLVWFERKSKYDHDCILLEWYKYASANRGESRNIYILPFKVDHMEGECADDLVLQTLTEFQLCSRGIAK